MSAPIPKRLAWLTLVIDALPVTMNALYEAARRGKAPFLHHIDPFTGQFSNRWAIDPDGLVLDYKRRGKHLNETFRLAVEAAAVVVPDVVMEAAQEV